MTQFKISTVKNFLEHERPLKPEHKNLLESVMADDVFEPEHEALMLHYIANSKSFDDLSPEIKRKMRFMTVTVLENTVHRMAAIFANQKGKMIDFFLNSNKEKMAEIQEKLKDEDERLNWEQFEEDLLDIQDDSKLIEKTIGDQYDINARLAFQMKFYEFTDGGKDQSIVDMIYALYEDYLAKIKEKGKNVTALKVKKAEAEEIKKWVAKYELHIYNVFKELAEEEKDYIYTDEMMAENEFAYGDYQRGLKSISYNILRCKQNKEEVSKRNLEIDKINIQRQKDGLELLPLLESMESKGHAVFNYTGAIVRLLLDETDIENPKNVPHPYLESVYANMKHDYEFCNAFFMKIDGMQIPNKMQTQTTIVQSVEFAKKYWLALPINVFVQTEEYKKFIKSRYNASLLASN